MKRSVPCTSNGKDLADARGFAATSTSQEWFEMGLQMFRESGNFEQANQMGACTGHVKESEGDTNLEPNN